MVHMSGKDMVRRMSATILLLPKQSVLRLRIALLLPPSPTYAGESTASHMQKDKPPSRHMLIGKNSISGPILWTGSARNKMEKKKRNKKRKRKRSHNFAGVSE